jgi:hypothetical protein
MSANKERSKQSSAKKVAANQTNAQASTGPRDTTSTRYNAEKHGLLAKGVTELDKPEDFAALVERLIRECQPVGILEHTCVQQIAIRKLRLERASLLEAEAFTAQLNPPKTIHYPGTLTAFDPETFGTTEVLDPGLPVRISNDAIDQINRTVLRYETANENKLMRWWNLLERLQALRRGDKVPAPAAVDVNVHHEGAGLASFGNSPHE